MTERVYQPVVDWFSVLASWTRFGRFLSVGIAGAIVDTAVTVLLVVQYGFLEEVAALVGIETSILLMFLLNEYWTFAGAGHQHTRARLRRFGRSHVVRASAIVLQFGIFVVVYRLFSVPLPVLGIDGWLVVAKAVGIGVGFVLNYVFESLFTWHVHR